MTENKYLVPFSWVITHTWFPSDNNNPVTCCLLDSKYLYLVTSFLANLLCLNICCLIDNEHSYLLPG